jgi:hypothetical protein
VAGIRGSTRLGFLSLSLGCLLIAYLLLFHGSLVFAGIVFDHCVEVSVRFIGAVVHCVKSFKKRFDGHADLPGIELVKVGEYAFLDGC